MRSDASRGPAATGLERRSIGTLARAVSWATSPWSVASMDVHEARNTNKRSLVADLGILGTAGPAADRAVQRPWPGAGTSQIRLTSARNPACLRLPEPAR
jgi:hypothetical protein